VKKGAISLQAAAYGVEPLVAALLNHGADTQCRNSLTWTPLHEARRAAPDAGVSFSRRPLPPFPAPSRDTVGVEHNPAIIKTTGPGCGPSLPAPGGAPRLPLDRHGAARRDAARGARREPAAIHSAHFTVTRNC
jgi:hypothetical protein